MTRKECHKSWTMQHCLKMSLDMIWHVVNCSFLFYLFPFFWGCWMFLSVAHSSLAWVKDTFSHFTIFPFWWWLVSVHSHGMRARIRTVLCVLFPSCFQTPTANYYSCVVAAMLVLLQWGCCLVKVLLNLNSVLSWQFMNSTTAISLCCLDSLQDLMAPWRKRLLHMQCWKGLNLF